MKNNIKLRPITAGIGLALGIVVGPVQGSPQPGNYLDFYWEGLFTMLDESGSPLANTSMPYYYDPTWGYGYRTPVSGTLSLDTNTGAGSFTMNPFSFFSGDGTIIGGQLQAIGNGLGDQGTLLLGNALFNWNWGATGIPLSIVWDASGLFWPLQDGLDWGEVITGTGVTPASDGIKKGNYPTGPAPLATFRNKLRNSFVC